MKKLLCMALCLIMVFSLCACGGNDTVAGSDETTATDNSAPTDNGASTEPSTNKNDPPKFVNDDGTIYIPEFAGQNTKLKSATSLENEYMKAEIIALNCSEKTVEFTVKVDNKTNEKFTFYFGFEYINGLRVEYRDRYETIDGVKKYNTVEQFNNVEGGKSREITFVYSVANLASSGIYKIYSGELGISAYQTIYDNSGNRTTIFDCGDMISFKTDEEGEQVNYTDGKMVYDKDGLKIVFQNSGWKTDNQVSHIRVYVENNSTVSYRVEMSAKIGYDGYNDRTVTTVSPNHSGYYTEWIGTDYPLEESRRFLKISTGLSMHSDLSWNGNDDPITFIFKDGDWQEIDE